MIKNNYNKILYGIQRLPQSLFTRAENTKGANRITKVDDTE